MVAEPIPRPYTKKIEGEEVGLFQEPIGLRTVRFVCLFFSLLFSSPFCSDASDAVWSDAVSVCIGEDVCRHPVVAVTADTVWVAWETDRNGNWDVYARSCTDGTWAPVVQMTESDSSDCAPVLVSDRLGHMWFVWESKQTGLWKVYARSFGGPTMTEFQASPLDAVGSLSPSAVADRLNRLWVVWQSPGSMALDSADVYGKYFDGVEWTSPFNITGHPADDGAPKVAADSAGNVWVVWRSDRAGNEDIFATFFDGVVWLDPPLHVASGPSGDFTPEISVDSRGRVWFGWMSNFNIFTRYYDGELSAVFQLTVGYYLHEDPSIVGDASSNVWVVWTRADGDEDLHARYYDGESWSSSDTAAAFEGNDRSPALAVDWMDNLWQVWERAGDIFLRSANIPPSAPVSGFEPAGGAKIRDHQPTVRWHAADEPADRMHYVIHLDISTFEEGSYLQYVTEDGATSFHVPDSLADNTHWFYRIQTVDPTGLGSEWSDVQDFYVDLFDEAPFPPSNFTIVGLSGGEITTETPTFLWSYGGDPDPLDTAGVTWYRLQIDDDLSWSDPVQVLSTQTGDTAATADSLDENRTYFARVQAIVLDEQLPSQWSATISFWINARNSAPSVEVLSPNGGEVWSGRQSVLWIASDLDDDPSALTITVELSPDGGRSWEALPEVDAAGNDMTTNDGLYLWDIPPTLRGRGFVIQVTASDRDTSTSDLSDARFLISSLDVDCQPRLFSPNGDGSDDEVTISFGLVEDSDVTVKVYDLAGRLVRLLKQNEPVLVSAGGNLARWDGRDENGHVVPNRLYIVAVVIKNSDGTETRTKTVVVLNR